MVDTDFQIGGIVKLGSYTFQILKADDFTIQYMKDRPEKFPETNLSVTVNKIKALSTSHSSYDTFLVWILKSKIFDNFRYRSIEQQGPQLRSIP